MAHIRNYTHFPEDWSLHGPLAPSIGDFIVGQRENGDLVICHDPYSPAPAWRRLPPVIECHEVRRAAEDFMMSMQRG